MITLALASSFTGFYLFYSTSQRAVLEPRSPLQRWVSINNSKAKLAGSALLFISFIACLFSLGTASGTFSFLAMLMMVASLVVLCAPLRFFTKTSLTIFFIVSLFLELYINHYAR